MPTTFASGSCVSSATFGHAMCSNPNANQAGGRLRQVQTVLQGIKHCWVQSCPSTVCDDGFTVLTEATEVVENEPASPGVASSNTSRATCAAVAIIDDTVKTKRTTAPATTLWISNQMSASRESGRQLETRKVGDNGDMGSFGMRDGMLAYKTVNLKQ